MSLLLYRNAPEGSWVVTDTLATEPDGTPFLFTSKCAVVPQMRMLIAGTGTAALVDRWRDLVQTSVRALDAAMLDVHAPDALRGLWAELGREHDLTDQTATVYHFGCDASTDTHRLFVYRSTSDFSGEIQQPGYGIKPHPLGEFSGPESIEEIVALATRIRDEQAALPQLERVCIGGELVLTALEKDTVTIRVIHAFDDHLDDWQIMNGAEPFHR